MKEYAEITYTDSRGNVFDLMARDIHWINSVTGFHEYEWEPEATQKRFGERLRSWKKKAREFTVTLIFQGTDNERAQMLNDFHEALEYDIFKFSPGVLKWEEYSIKCFGRSSKTSPVNSNEYALATANEVIFYASNPFWTKLLEFKTYSDSDNNHRDAYINGLGTPYTRNWFLDEDNELIIPQEGLVYDVKTPGEFFGKSFIWRMLSEKYLDLTGEDWIKDYEDGFDYAYDYMYRYEGEKAGTIINPNILGSKYIMKIYGPADAPYITIRNNLTFNEVVVSFPTLTKDLLGPGCVLEVNSIDKTVILTTSEWLPEKQEYGKINCFGMRDLDHYLWDTVDGGPNAVIIDGTYKVDLQLYEERSEPKWLLV